jgi:hypothetical protein
MHTLDGDAAQAIFAANLGPTRTDERVALTRLQMAAIELARGRPRAAHAHFASVSSVFPSVARDLEIYYALRSPVPPSHAELVAMRQRLSTPLPGRQTRTRRMQLPATIVAADPHIRLALLSEVSERLGDAAAADRYAADLETMPVAAGVVGARDLVRREWRAHRALAAGRPATALAEVAHLPRRDPEAGALGFPWAAGIRAATALALERSGREREALEWHQSFEHQSLFVCPFIGPRLLHAASIRERLGDKAAAAAAYARVLEYWSDAEPQYQAFVREARDRLAAVRQ